MSLIVYEHPLSPYAQKVKIALDEKGVAYETKMPAAIGTGQIDKEFLSANPRGEVPALIDGEAAQNPGVARVIGEAPIGPRRRADKPASTR